jgi:putative membrane protein
MRIIINILLSALAVVIGAYLLPGVHIDNFWDAIIVAIVISLINNFVRPVLVILTIPITIFSFGLFLFVIDAVLIMFAGNIIKGFQIDGFWPALLFSIILSILTWIFIGRRRG